MRRVRTSNERTHNTTTHQHTNKYQQQHFEARVTTATIQDSVILNRVCSDVSSVHLPALTEVCKEDTMDGLCVVEGNLESFVDAEIEVRKAEVDGEVCRTRDKYVIAEELQ